MRALLTTNRYGTVRYRYPYYMVCVLVYIPVGKAIFIRQESDAALDATAAVQGKQSAAITSIHET